MRIKVGVMGSAGETHSESVAEELRAKAEALGGALAARGCVALTGGTTGLPHMVGVAAQRAGALHVGVSPAENEREHVERYKLPVEGTDVLIYTGFGLKGRNVVLVRSCDVVLFIAGAMGSLNEFTIAHDEGKVIGCLTETGGVADEAEYLLQKFSRPTGAQVLLDTESEHLLSACLDAINQ